MKNFELDYSRTLSAIHILQVGAMLCGYFFTDVMSPLKPVAYTHLDVYKRQPVYLLFLRV